MISKNEILNQLIFVKASLERLGVTQVGLFGSYSTGTATDKSDIDILIDFDPTQETFDHLLESCTILENTFAMHKVDVVSKNGLSKYIGPHILQQTIYV